MIKNKNNIDNLRYTSRRKICGKLTISEIWFRLRLYIFNMRPFKIKMRNNHSIRAKYTTRHSKNVVGFIAFSYASN